MNFLKQITASFAQPAAENPAVEMIEAAYRHHQLDWRYINFEVAPSDLADAVRGARAMRFAGFNCSRRATVWDGRTCGVTTDNAGLDTAIRSRPWTRLVLTKL